MSKPMSWRPTGQDWALLVLLRERLGVGYTSVLRLALRALAAKEGLPLPGERAEEVQP